jgi:hypothetical protein
MDVTEGDNAKIALTKVSHLSCFEQSDPGPALIFNQEYI